MAENIKLPKWQPRFLTISGLLRRNPMSIAKLKLSLLMIVLLLGAKAVFAQEYPKPVCDVVIYDERSELEDARLAVDQAKTDFAAYEKIFTMIKGLWEAKTIPEMDYLKAKFDRDASRLKLEKNDLILERQSALVEQYRLLCNAAESRMAAPEKSSAIWKVYLRYRRADCDSLAKSIEIAANNLEYNREYLKKITKLRDEKFANDSQVILAARDVELEEKGLADAKLRTAACRTERAALEAGTPK
jgi:hypothetical protein